MLLTENGNDDQRLACKARAVHICTFAVHRILGCERGLSDLAL